MNRHNYQPTNLPRYRPRPPLGAPGPRPSVTCYKYKGVNGEDDMPLRGNMTPTQPHSIQRIDWKRPQSSANNYYGSGEADTSGSGFHSPSTYEHRYIHNVSDSPYHHRYNAPDRSKGNDSERQGDCAVSQFPIAPHFEHFEENPRPRQTVGNYSVTTQFNQHPRPSNVNFPNFNASQPPPPLRPPLRPPPPPYLNSAGPSSMQHPNIHCFRNHPFPRNQLSSDGSYDSSVKPTHTSTLPPNSAQVEMCTNTDIVQFTNTQKEVRHEHMPAPITKGYHQPCDQQTMDSSDFCQSTVMSEKDVKRAEDRQWINSWFTRKGYNHHHHHHRSSHQCVVGDMCSVPTARQKLREAILLSKELHSMTSKPEGIEQDATQTNIYMRFDIIKEKLANLKKFFTDEQLLSALEKKVKRISRKRDCKRRQRALWYEKHLEEMAKREEIHQRLNEWQHKIEEQAAQTKREKEMKQAADSILSEVHTKLGDVKRSVDLIEAISKLRNVRKALADSNGVALPKELDSNFQERKDTAVSMLAKQKEIYDAEKKTLEVMLEIEKEENEERKKEEDEQRTLQQRIRVEKRLRRSLFGPKQAELKPSDELYRHRQYHDAANHDLQAFIAIREEWDKLLVPMNTQGDSSIPEHWVIPPEPSSESWAATLKD